MATYTAKSPIKHGLSPDSSGNSGGARGQHLGLMQLSLRHHQGSSRRQGNTSVVKIYEPYIYIMYIIICIIYIYIRLCLRYIMCLIYGKNSEIDPVLSTINVPRKTSSGPSGLLLQKSGQNGFLQLQNMT